MWEDGSSQCQHHRLPATAFGYIYLRRLSKGNNDPVLSEQTTQGLQMELQHPDNDQKISLKEGMVFKWPLAEWGDTMFPFVVGYVVSIHTKQEHYWNSSTAA